MEGLPNKRKGNGCVLSRSALRDIFLEKTQYVFKTIDKIV